MREDRLAELSMEFAAEIIQLAKRLQEQKEYTVSRQIGRSGTSIGANIREARYASSRADFVLKLQIALKEANETTYWLELMLRTAYLTAKEYDRLENMCRQLRIMLAASLNTAKENK